MIKVFLTSMVLTSLLSTSENLGKPPPPPGELRHNPVMIFTASVTFSKTYVPGTGVTQNLELHALPAVRPPQELGNVKFKRRRHQYSNIASHY